jgi:hypothetical protein
MDPTSWRSRGVQALNKTLNMNEPLILVHLIVSHETTTDLPQSCFRRHGVACLLRLGSMSIRRRDAPVGNLDARKTENLFAWRLFSPILTSCLDGPKPMDRHAWPKRTLLLVLRAESRFEKLVQKTVQTGFTLLAGQELLILRSRAACSVLTGLWPETAEQ